MGKFGKLLLVGVVLTFPHGVSRAGQTDSETERYAADLLRAAQFVADRYVVEKDASQLAAESVEGLYDAVHERMPRDLRNRLRVMGELTDIERVALIREARDGIGHRKGLTSGRDLKASIDAMVRQLDPYSRFTDAATKARANWSLWTNYSGVGLSYQWDPCLNLPVVQSPLRGGPAERAGIQQGDLITHFTVSTDAEGRPLPKPRVLSATGMAAADIDNLLVGAPGTPLTLTIERLGESTYRTFSLRHEFFELEAVYGYERYTDGSWNYIIDARNRIAYVRLPNFYVRDLAAKVAHVLDTLEGEGGLNGLVLDLRFNPGGRIHVGVDIARLFLSEGQAIASIHMRDHVDRHRCLVTGKYARMPLVCLINGESASCSEIVAAALQDHNRGVIIGERSFGKGTVQQVFPFADGDLKLTNARWHRPNGDNLDKAFADGGVWGVRPDREVKLTPKQTDDLRHDQQRRWIIARTDVPPAKAIGSDPQLARALTTLRTK